ncbi:MAG: hypothetical protein WCA13_16015 [Terriglobales bacterium]
MTRPTLKRGLIRVWIVLAVGFDLACVENKPAPDAKAGEPAEQNLTITYGGFIQNGPEDQLLNGVCGTDLTRNVLNCDVHNGLVDWNVTEVTFQVIPTGDSEQHYYRERLSIAPLQTGHVSIRLGMQLPADDYIKLRGRPGGRTQTHWNWLIVEAKGKHTK